MFCPEFELYFGTSCCTSVTAGVLSQLWTLFWNTLLHVRYLCRKMPPVQLLSCVPCCEVRKAAAAAAWEPVCCVCPIVWVATCHSSCDEDCSPISRRFPVSVHLLYEYTTVCSHTGGDEGYGICPVSITEVTDFSDQRRRLTQSSTRIPVVRLASCALKLK
jgi:hypothetical protein